MTKYEYVSRNILNIKEGIMYGLISTCILSHFRIYAQLENYLAMGLTLPKAIFLLSEDNKVSEQTIYRIKWEMEAEI